MAIQKIFLYIGWLIGKKYLHTKPSAISDKYFVLNSKSSKSIDENWLFFHDNFLEVINCHESTKVSSKRIHLL